MEKISFGCWARPTEVEVVFNRSFLTGEVGILVGDPKPGKYGNATVTMELVDGSQKNFPVTEVAPTTTEVGVMAGFDLEVLKRPKLPSPLIPPQ